MPCQGENKICLKVWKTSGYLEDFYKSFDQLWQTLWKKKKKKKKKVSKSI